MRFEPQGWLLLEVSLHGGRLETRINQAFEVVIAVMRARAGIGMVMMFRCQPISIPREDAVVHDGNVS